MMKPCRHSRDSEDKDELKQISVSGEPQPIIEILDSRQIHANGTA